MSTEQRQIERVLSALERIASACERIAEQQREFLAVMPAEDQAPDEDVKFPEHSPGCGARYSEFKDCTCPAENNGKPHAYDAACACRACWAERQRRKNQTPL